MRLARGRARGRAHAHARTHINARAFLDTEYWHDAEAAVRPTMLGPGIIGMFKPGLGHKYG